MRLANGLALLLLLALLAASVGAAVSASEAVSFVETENNFLKPNEQLETPAVPVLHDEKKYWVVPLLSGEGVATYFPVSFADKSLSTNTAVNNQLFSTVQFLRDYLAYRNKLAQQNKSFFISRGNQLIVGNLASDLSSAVFELNVIKSELPGQQQQSLITSMQSSLNHMSGVSTDLSQKIGAGVDAESSFTNEPDSKDLESINNSFSAAFAQLYALEEEARAYETKVSQLKGFIANSSLSPDTKTQFIARASAPPGLKTIGGNLIGDWVILSQETEQSIAQLLSKAKSKVFLDSMQQELEKRIERNRAYAAIFSPDQDFSKKTGYASLKMAMDDLQSVEKKSLWQNQAQLAVAIEQYQSAGRLLDSEEFDLSMVATQKAKLAAVNVKKDGFVPEETDSFDWSMAINIAIVAVILLAVVYFLKNRNRIIGAVASEEPQQVDKYGWPKN
jgi:hypothetical protein